MNITLSFIPAHENEDYYLPDGIDGTIITKRGQGLDGSVVIVIVQIAESVLNSAASIATIAGFIYMIIHDKRNAKAVIDGKRVPEPATPELIEKQLTQQKED